jgi:hypothetical protein
VFTSGRRFGSGSVFECKDGSGSTIKVMLIRNPVLQNKNRVVVCVKDVRMPGGVASFEFQGGTRGQVRDEHTVPSLGLKLKKEKER